MYFDDFKVTITPSNIIQVGEYYPFGLQTAQSWTRETTTGNNFLYDVASELNTTTGFFDLPYRNYDASATPIPKNNGYQIFQLGGMMNDKTGVFEIGLTVPILKFK